MTSPRKTSTSPAIKKERADNETSQSLIVRALTEAEAPRNKTVGRPARLEMPALPRMPMEEVERDLFDYFMASYKEQYPDMVPTDHLILHLAALEYIKYLRVVAEELETGRVISMARQHPGVNMRALLDQLSVTRKARTLRSKPDEDPNAAELRDFFLEMSKQEQRKARG